MWNSFEPTFRLRQQFPNQKRTQRFRKGQQIREQLQSGRHHSRLLGDFLDITFRERRRMLSRHLEARMWVDYISGCRGRDPELPEWSDQTVRKLRSVVFSMIADAGYVDNTKNLQMQNVFIDTRLANYLIGRREDYVIKCLEVAG